MSGHQFTRPGQVEPGRPAPDACMVCGQPETAHRPAPAGPFDTEREARAAAHAAVPPDAGWSILSAAGNRQLLGRALEDAGVLMGRYDDRIAEWLTRWEDAAVAVIAGWVQRARGLAPADLALILAALDDAAEARRERTEGNCADCARLDLDGSGLAASLCPDHQADTEAAAAYTALRARLDGAS